jgi:carboxyl-terminal processing protease
MNHRRPLAVTVTVAAVAALIGYGATTVFATGSANAARPPACAKPSGDPPERNETSVVTIGQAYHCVFDNYVTGPILDPRTLLVPAFTAVTQELQRRGLEQPNATLPALSGRRDQDWAAFRRTYDQIAANLPPDAAVRQAVARAAIAAMVEALHDNHAHWANGMIANTTGLRVDGMRGPIDPDPAATAPLSVTEVAPNSPAAAAGVRAGDEILTVNDVPPYIDGEIVPGVLRWVTNTSAPGTLRLSLRRPATGAVWTVTLTIAQGPTPGPEPGAEPSGPPTQPPAEARLVDGDLAYVKVTGFAPGVTDSVLAAIADLRTKATLRGLILDLRGNGGGDPAEVARLTGAFAHGRTTSYWCDIRDRCTPNRTNDSVPLVNLRLVALTDRDCASACDSFSSAVKDLKLGTLVGTRTAGIVSGPADPWVLDDGSALLLPKVHEIAANREIVNSVGVAPDHYAPVTADDLSNGRDPGLARAIELF